MASILHSVGKYRKLWISILMGLSMLTFVLCAGNKSDITETILKNFTPHRGDPVASINGYNFYREDSDALKAERSAANAYIRSIVSQLVEFVNDRSKKMPEKMEDEQQKRFNQILQVKSVLSRRYQSPNFFDTGTKVPDLVDFKTWLLEADRLGISISDDELRKLIDLDTFRNVVLGAFAGSQNEVVQLDRQMQRQAELKVRDETHTVSPSMLRRGLMDEYRVRIAKLAAIEFQLSTVDRSPFKRIRPTEYMPAQLTRLALTPAQLYDYYSDNRTELDAVLLEIPVSSFLGQVGEPDARALDALFNKEVTSAAGTKAPAKSTAFDPESPDPGFRNPHLIQLKWVTGDPNSPFFKSLAKTADALAAFPVFSVTSPMPLTDVLRIAAGQAVYDTRLDQDYRLENRPLFAAMETNPPAAAGLFAGDLTATLGSYFAGTDPVAAAGLVGSLAMPDGIFASGPLYVAGGLAKNKATIDEALRIEVKRRAPVYASLIGSGASSPLTTLGLVSLKRSPAVLAPLPIVRKTLTEIIERRQANKWISDNILFLKKQMEREGVPGDELQMKRLLERFGPDYAKASEGNERNRNLGLEIGETKKAFNRYDVDTDPELKPLRDSYDKYYAQINAMEGRDGISGKKPWKQDEFWRIFFDGTETAGVAGETRKFAAHPWPPTVKLGNPTQLDITMQGNGLADMDAGAQAEFNAARMSRESNRETTIDLIAHTDRPFLIWKTYETAGDPPRSVDDIKDRVVTAWKMLEARDKKALPFVQKIAEGLLRGNADYRTSLSIAGKDQGAKLVDLSNLAKLTPTTPANPFGGGGDFGPYKLHGEIKYPRDDTVPSLLALNGLKEPIKIGVADIDNLNAALFAEAQKANRGPSKFVQILTNKPRDTFYIAVLNGPPTPVGWRDLTTMLRGGASNRDTLVNRAQAHRGEEFMQSFILQLRERYKVKINESAKTIDSDVGT
jgi:hypothetical protein